MKISTASISLLKEIYKLSEDSYSNSIDILPQELAKTLNISREFIYKCLHYLNEKGLLFVDPSYIKPESSEVKKHIKITAKGIDLIEDEI